MWAENSDFSGGLEASCTRLKDVVRSEKYVKKKNFLVCCGLERKSWGCHTPRHLCNSLSPASFDVCCGLEFCLPLRSAELISDWERWQFCKYELCVRVAISNLFIILDLCKPVPLLKHTVTVTMLLTVINILTVTTGLQRHTADYVKAGCPPTNWKGVMTTLRPF